MEMGKGKVTGGVSVARAERASVTNKNTRNKFSFDTPTSRNLKTA